MSDSDEDKYFDKKRGVDDNKNVDMKLKYRHEVKLSNESLECKLDLSPNTSECAVGVPVEQSHTPCTGRSNEEQIIPDESCRRYTIYSVEYCGSGCIKEKLSFLSRLKEMRKWRTDRDPKSLLVQECT
jgi:hypothetical protein